MATVYRSACRGELLWTDATRAVYVLNAIAQLDQGLGVDRRLAEIETRLAAIKPNGSAGRELHA